MDVQIVTEYMRDVDDLVDVAVKRANQRRLQARNLMQHDVPPSEIVLATKRMFKTQDVADWAEEIKRQTNAVIESRCYSEYAKAMEALETAITLYETAERDMCALSQEYERVHLARVRGIEA